VKSSPHNKAGIMKDADIIRTCDKDRKITKDITIGDLLAESVKQAKGLSDIDDILASRIAKLEKKIAKLEKKIAKLEKKKA